MTKAVFKQKGEKFEIRISGHAGDSAVCASCSTLAYTLQQCLLAEHRAGNFEFYVQDVKLEEGECFIRARAKKQTVGYIETIVGVIATGYALLQDQYKEHVSVEYYDSGDKVEAAKRS